MKAASEKVFLQSSRRNRTRSKEPEVCILLVNERTDFLYEGNYENTGSGRWEPGSEPHNSPLSFGTILVFPGKQTRVV